MTLDDGSIFDELERWVNVKPLSEMTPEELVEQRAKAWIKLEEILEENFPRKFFVLEICLSVRAQLKIQGLTLPFALFLLGNPSTKKSTILSILNEGSGCYKSDKFTPRSFVSHSANVSKKDLNKVDLLPKLQYKLFLTPELAPLFGADREHLMENFATLTRVLDGQGLQTESGVHGQRGYSGDYYFMWIGAVVDIPHNVWKLLGNLGPRIYFYRIPDDPISVEDKIVEIIKSSKGKIYTDKLKICHKATNLVWNFIASNPANNENGKLDWNATLDDEQTHRKIIDVAMLLSRLRGTVPTWFTGGSNSSGTNYHYERPTIEDPERASNALYNLARGHAVLFGRNYITEDDLPVVLAVALSSAQIERVELFRFLLEQKGEISTEEITKLVKVSANTARKNMKMLEILGLVDFPKDEGYKIRLKKEFSWFLSDEFKKYRDILTHTHRVQNSASSRRAEKNPLCLPEGAEKKGVCVFYCQDCNTRWKSTKNIERSGTTPPREQSRTQSRRNGVRGVQKLSCSA